MNKKHMIIGLVSFIGIALLLLVVLPFNSGDQQAGDNLTQEEVEEGLDLQTNGADGTYVVNLISGNFEGETEGQVLTDTDCAPDDAGISRCHNQIKLPNENEITVVNPHNMEDNRCLKPGETVRLDRNEEGKVTVKLMEI